jgi:hypothetical protein
MAKFGSLLTITVVKKNKEAAKAAKLNDPFSQSLTQGRQTQGQSPQVRLLAAYQTLRSALVSSTTTSPETFRQAQKDVRNDQRTRSPDKKVASISVKQIDERIVQLKQVVVQQNAQQTASGTVYEAKESAQTKTTEQPREEAVTPPEVAQKSISLEIEDNEEPITESDQAQAEQNDVPQGEAPAENKPSLPPIAPRPDPIREAPTLESSPQDSQQPPHLMMKELPQGRSFLRQRIEMNRIITDLRGGNLPSNPIDSLWRIATGRPGLSGGSMGPEAILSGGGAPEAVGALAGGGAPAAGMPGSAAAQGTKLASQLPKLASAAKLAAAGISASTIAWIVVGILGVFLVLLLFSGGGGNVASHIPTNEFLPLGTGSGEADPNVLYGDAVPVDVENPCWPVGGEITQLPNLEHGTRCGNKGVGVAYHQAIDIAASIGTKVYAPYAGRVCIKETTPMGSDGKLLGYGVYLVICTDLGFDMVFAHLNDYASGIKQGDQVTKGQLIAFSGHTGNSTGPHLHFEITNLAVCRPYNILDIVPAIPASKQVVESCSQYLGSELEYEPI